VVDVIHLEIRNLRFEKLLCLLETDAVLRAVEEIFVWIPLELDVGLGALSQGTPMT
jgi:hypothetical protein